MSGDSFEWAIKKDVRNNPIVREVDRERHREMWRSASIGIFLVVVLLFSVWQHFEMLQYGYQMEQMQQQRADEEEIRRHLRLEIEALRSPSRIERVATRELRMVSPGPADATVIERVIQAPVPPRSVVAHAVSGFPPSRAENPMHASAWPRRSSPAGRAEAGSQTSP